MNWKIHLYRAILWLITLSLLLLMFGFSAQEGVQSGSISGKIARPITDSLAQRQGLTGQAYWKLYAQVDFAVRKTAHFLEYTLLGMLLTLLLDSYRARWHWLSWAGCTLYAATDEIHQLFVAGRTGKWQDVLLDSSGALAGLLLAARSDYIEVNGRRYPRTPVALSEQPVSDGGGYHALWGAAEERGRGHEAVDVAEAAVAQSAKAG